MSFSFLNVALVCIGYLLLIFGIAYSSERDWLPRKITEHPITYILSLGIFASAWAFYGVIDLAFQFGYGALAYYVGTGVLFLFAPVALEPISDLARRHQIHSLADLLVFRYHSHGIGALTTMCMVLGLLPLMALQIQAIADTLNIMTLASGPAYTLTETGASFKDLMAFTYCIILTLFTILFGANREHHRGLITAMAFESLLKIFALCAIGLLAVYGVFDGFSGLDLWLEENPDKLALLHAPIQNGSSHTLLLVFIATAITMPHIFHISVAENPLIRNTRTITWAFPLFLFFLAVPIFPILWAGLDLEITLPTQYFTLGIPIETNHQGLAVLAFVGGLSASTGAMVVITLALSTMIMNHWVLPFLHFQNRPNIYSQLIWLKRILIAAFFFGAYLFYWSLNNKHSLFDLALVAFIETLQFLPGIVAIIYWTRGNRRGLITGLIAGTTIWGAGLLLPLTTHLSSIPLPMTSLVIPIGIDHWNSITVLSLGLNTLIFVCVSLFTQQTEGEAYSAELCASDDLSHPTRQALDVFSVKEFKERLAKTLGKTTASREVKTALQELELTSNERRPYALRRLREKIEANLSGLIGIHVAGEIMDKHFPFTLATDQDTIDINLIESRLSQYRNHLTGLSVELDNLRLHHRKTLQELPMAVCSLGRDEEILMWNCAMAELTKVSTKEVVGSHLNGIEEPWNTLLQDFLTAKEAHSYKNPINLKGKTHWISLHKASIEGPTNKHDETKKTLNKGAYDQVILLEDVTETQRLEQELMHNERLASVGRLAAGVAHEIGNPITGIACLAQNLQYETEPSEILETSEQILSQTERVTRIVLSLVNYSHNGQNKEHQFEAVILKDCAGEAIHLLSLQHDKNRIEVVNHIAENAIILGDAQQMIQVFVNLISNARDASPAQSHVMLESANKKEHIQLLVSDQGKGIPQEQFDHVFEPFFTTKEPGEGTGLGLAMVYSIIDNMNGSIEIKSPTNTTNNSGTQFTIKLPRHLNA